MVTDKRNKQPLSKKYEKMNLSSLIQKKRRNNSVEIKNRL